MSLYAQLKYMSGKSIRGIVPEVVIDFKLIFDENKWELWHILTVSTLGLSFELM